MGLMMQQLASFIVTESIFLGLSWIALQAPV